MTLLRVSSDTASLLAACFLGACAAPTGGPGGGSGPGAPGKADGTGEGAVTYRFASAHLSRPADRYDREAWYDRTLVLERRSAEGEIDGSLVVRADGVTHVANEDRYACGAMGCEGVGDESHLRGMRDALGSEAHDTDRVAEEAAVRFERGTRVAFESDSSESFRASCQNGCEGETDAAVLTVLRGCVETALSCAYPDGGSEGCWSSEDGRGTVEAACFGDDLSDPNGAYLITLRGTVTDEHGDPLRGAQVRFTGTPGSKMAFTKGAEDHYSPEDDDGEEDGQYEIERFVPGDYSLRIQKGDTVREKSGIFIERTARPFDITVDWW